MSYITQFASLLCAGTMMLTSSLEAVTPQRDITGSLFLVSRAYRVSEDYVPPLVQADVSGSLRSMRPEAAAALEDMFAACKEEAGVTLVTVSGYRSYSKQKNIYNNKLKSVGSEEKADEYVARPGASEHQLGMAMDVGQRNSSAGLTSSFANTKGGEWIAENCWRFGFILRYQEGWEDITGYSYEPWHVRYVGPEHAKAMYEADVPMETYMEELREQVMIDLLALE